MLVVVGDDSDSVRVHLVVVVFPSAAGLAVFLAGSGDFPTSAGLGAFSGDLITVEVKLMSVFSLEDNGFL